MLASEALSCEVLSGKEFDLRSKGCTKCRAINGSQLILAWRSIGNKGRQYD